MTLKIVAAQMNSIIGDFSGNVAKMLAFAEKAKNTYHADLIVFPELCLCGYSPEDLLLREDFIAASYAALLAYAKATPDIMSLVGFPAYQAGVLKNTAALIEQGRVAFMYCKQALPNYGVFDEKRYFTAGNELGLISCKNVVLGISICEDIWVAEVAQALKKEGAQFLINLSASPFELDKHEQRLNVLRARQAETALPILYVNCVGGQDDIIFDGGSLCLDAAGDVVMQLPHFEEACGFVSFNALGVQSQDFFKNQDPRALIYEALILGVRDYVKKNRFKKVIVGSSGGIDSAVTLAIAVEALGKENVISVMMPSQYTSSLSLEYASLLAKNLHIEHHVMSIQDCFECFLASLKPIFHNLPEDKTEENLQARCRGTLLMALSNKWNALVLTTSNRSEMAVGYATLYGDMAGSYAVLKDLYKTQVYDLAHYINRKANIIPEVIMTRAPSAELRDNQKDEDSLPPYPILDALLMAYLDRECSIQAIVSQGFDPQVVKDVVKLIHLNEYKRQQAPPGVRIHGHSFGRKDRRYPITERSLSNDV